MHDAIRSAEERYDKQKAIAEELNRETVLSERRTEKMKGLLQEEYVKLAACGQAVIILREILNEPVPENETPVGSDQGSPNP